MIMAVIFYQWIRQILTVAQNKVYKAANNVMVEITHADILFAIASFEYLTGSGNIW